MSDGTNFCPLANNFSCAGVQSTLVRSSGLFPVAQALHGLAPKCKLINMHELINKSTNDYVTLLPCENGGNVNN